MCTDTLFGFCFCFFHSRAGNGLARRTRHVRPRRSFDAVFFGRRHGRVRVRPWGARVFVLGRCTFWAIVPDVVVLCRVVSTTRGAAGAEAGVFSFKLGDM